MAWAGLATHLSLASPTRFFFYYWMNAAQQRHFCFISITVRWEASSKAPAFPACFPFGCCRTPSRSFLLALIILPANQPVRREDWLRKRRGGNISLAQAQHSFTTQASTAQPPPPSVPDRTAAECGESASPAPSLCFSCCSAPGCCRRAYPLQRSMVR